MDDGRVLASPSLSWTQQSGPPGVLFSQPPSATTSATLPGVGVFELRLDAFDGQLSGSDVVRVTVAPELPPSLDAADATVREGNEGQAGASVEVRLSKPWAVPVSVDYVTRDATAVNPCDYRRRFGTLEFAAGETSRSVLVPVVGDHASEGDELLDFLLGNPVGGILGRDRAVVSVTDDDDPNRAPAAHQQRSPANGSAGVTSPATLSWSTSDPDAGDALTHDVYLGTGFSLGGQQWLTACPEGVDPGPRWGAATGYDENNDRLIVYGGETTAAADTDVYVLTNASATGGAPAWERYSPAGGPGPLAHAAFGYDAAANRLVLFGGCRGTCASPSDETWVLANANGLGAAPAWTRLAASGPAARFGSAAAFDAAANRLYVHGGAASEAGPALADTWVLASATGLGTPTWQALAPAGAPPVPRRFATLTLDAASGRLVLFGGRDAEGSALSDLHILKEPGGTTEWTPLQPEGEGPAARLGHAAAFDPSTHRLLVYGGSNGGLEEGLNYVFSDAWLLTDADGLGAAPEWVRADGGPTPVGRFGAAAAWSPGANRLIVFAGANNKLAAPPADLWLLGDAFGQLPLVSAGQSASSYSASEALDGRAYVWRVVSRDSHGAWRGTPAWSFTANRPPIVNAGSDRSLELPPGRATLAGTASDDGLPAGASLQTEWTVVSSPAPVHFDDPASVATALTVEAPGTYVLRLTADDSGATTTDTVVLSVTAANQAPSVNAGPDRPAPPGIAVTLSGTVSDDGLPSTSLDIAWSQLSGPAPVTFGTPAAAVSTALFSQPGLYVLRLSGSDGALSTTDDVTVSVSAYPDLVAAAPNTSQVTWDARTLTVGGSLAATVANQGAGPALGPFTLTVFEDRDGNGTLGAADAVLGSTAIASLLSGGSLTLPVALAGSVLFPGNAIHALVDSANAVAESDESNNLASTLEACAAPAPPPFAARLEWWWPGPTSSPVGNVMMTPIVADLDRDGTPEVLVMSAGFGLTVLDGRTGALEYNKVFVGGASTILYTQLAVGNLDADPELEIVVPTLNRLHVVEHDGTLKWTRSNVEDAGSGGPAIADLDGDGQPEIVLGRQVFGADGTLRWTGTGGRGNGAYGPLSLVADLDLDGRPEVVAGNTAYRADGTIYWSNGTFDGFDAIGNFDADPFPEIVMMSAGTVRLLEHTGAVKWIANTTLLSGGGGPPTVADFDGDGRPEIGIAGLANYVVIDTDGSVLWSAPTQDGSSRVTGSTVFDFDGDGSLEVVYRDELHLWVFRGRDGSVLWSRPMTSCTSQENPVVADVDGDGAAEIVVSAETSCFAPDSGIYAFGDGSGSGWVGARSIWNQHTYHVTNVEDDGRIPTREANSWESFNSYRQQKATSGCALARADLVPSYARAVKEASEVAVSIRIGNAGNAAAPAAVPIAFYAGDPAEGGVFLGTATTAGAIAPASFLDVTLRLPLATEALPLFVVADDQGGLHGTLPERDEANNTLDTRLFLSPIANAAPAVSAGPDATLLLPPGAYALQGSVTDDGRPLGKLTLSWGLVSGPAPVAFTNGTSPTATASFAQAGTYVLRLRASDEELTTADDVTITVERANQAPVVDAGPDATVTAPAATLHGSASDDGLPSGSSLSVRWEQLAGPAPTVLATPLATVTSAVFGAEGSYLFRLSATDSALTSADTVAIEVHFTNTPPAVSAGPDLAVTTRTGTLRGSVSDDGLPLGSVLTQLWTQTAGPAAALLASPASTETSVRFEAPGTYGFRLSASDSQATGEDTALVSVSFINLAPVAAAGADQTIALPANAVALAGTATDDELPVGAAIALRWSVTSGPGAVTLADPTAGATTAHFTDPGTYVLTLVASDGALSGEDSLVVRVLPTAAGGAPPEVALSSPAVGTRVTQPIDVVGSVRSSALASWQLESRLAGEPSWTRFAVGTTPAEAAVLGRLDPTLLLNGSHEIRLTATDTAGRVARASAPVVVRDNLKVGHFTVSFTDLEVPVAGQPIRVTRTYDSRDKRNGDFGYGWRLDVSNVRVQTAATLGLAWYGSVSASAFANYCLQPTAPPLVTLSFPDGRVQEFELRLTPSCQSFLPIDHATVSFVPVGPTLGTLELVGSSSVEVIGSWPGAMQLFNSGYSLFNPDLYRYTSPDGQVFVVDKNTGLKSLTDRAGNVLTMTPLGITSQHPQVAGSTLGVVFQRDAQGRITRITDPLGNSLAYVYDTSGDLASATDRESHTTTFGYLDDPAHHLETIEDPLGRTPIRNEYDPTGRLIAHVDAFGHRIEYQHDLVGRQEIVRDRTGAQRVLEYDERGNVLRETDPQGRVVVRSFDARNNRLTETEPYDPASPPNPAPATSYSYDPQDNLLSTRDALGHATSYTYNATRQVLTTKDARSQTTTNAYDAKGNLLTTSDALGNTTGYAYDLRGNVLTQTSTVGGVAQITRYEYDTYGRLAKETDATGHATSYSYDSSGNRLTQTTTRTAYTCSSSAPPVCSSSGTETLVTRHTYDANGRLETTTDPDGSVTRTVYDALGRQVESRDKLDRSTTYEYDEMGRLVRTTYADGTLDEHDYDAEGRRTSTKDRGGRTTLYDYDALGRLKRTTYADATFSESTYDAAGRLIASKDARGKTTAYEYDSAGRRTAVVDPLQQRTSFTYDANGNQETVTDARGQTTRYEYDALNRRTKAIFPSADGVAAATSTTTGYDELGRRTSETDPAGRTTRFEYDTLGRLTAVVDALNQHTVYSYDELGNRLSQTDANGHTTWFLYDRLGRQTARVLPDGKREQMSYDLAGNLLTRTDFMGRPTTYAYDVNSRLLSRTYPIAAENVAFSYTATGRRATATDIRGTTRYGYDLRDRLVSLTQPGFGTGTASLGYTYDGSGNRLTLTAAVGGQSHVTRYTYDDAGRLDVVTDPAGRPYDHGYDANGNRASIAQPNGAITAYGYDNLNRLTNLATTVPSLARTIQTYAFTLGPAGNRTRIVEAQGLPQQRTLDYSYDSLYRLTGEAATESLGLVYNKAFAYDPVGNRRTQTTAIGPAGSAGPNLQPGTIDYGYDTRDRLLTERLGAAPATAYGWDANGNLTTKDGEATYTWSAENRLTRVAKADGTVVDYLYDGDGTRVQTRTTKPGQSAESIDYLVDTSGSLSQVVLEVDSLPATPALRALYVRGDDLLAVLRPLIAAPSSATDWQTRYYHADGIGSIRRLTDEAGNITDGYTYSAFGELLAHTGTDPQPYAFTGEPLDPNSGFQYHRARWMDPRTGRFTGMDSFGGNGSDPASLHRYLYAYASPISNTDPTGLFTLPSLATISAVLTTINTISLVTIAAVFGYRAGTIGNDLLIEEKIELEDALEDVADLGGDIALSIAGYRLLNFEGLKFAGSLMRKLPSMAGRIKLWNVAHVNGRLAEHYIGNAYGLFRNNLPIPSGRVPDFVTNSLLREIKNVIRLRWTQQLADMADFCVATGRKYYLHVRPGTQVAAKVENELLARFGPGSKGVLWDIITDVPEALRVIP